ncbi:DUF3558 family protein [Crossiella cryophila]|uniref:DUF3558 domain-containing protein n=1 Tax=Crossiella cryophila TaxID=43355 RepID=A0A7W7CM75_9PSEU|nr:DUF3558 family protein [Crossiella cryophila]MBB4682353.1 hypothetical protein [Crossiella cryophila]
MTVRRWVLGSMLVSVAVLVTACGGGAAPTPPGTQAATSSATAAGDWTKVTTQPKTVEGGFRTAPCEALTPAQLTEFKLPDKPKAATASCTWTNYENSRASVEVELYNSTLLQKFGPDAPKPESGLVVGKVAGYPAVRSPEGKDQRGCMVFASISAKETLRAYFSSYRSMPEVTQDACGLAEKVLTAVIEKLPAAA